MEAHICSRCGGTLTRKDEFYVCDYCRAKFEDDVEEREAVTLKGLLDEAKLERLSNARRALYDQVHRENPSVKKTLACVHDVLSLYPDDVLARFYDAILDEDPALLNELLRGLEVDGPTAEEIVRYGVKGLKLRNVMAFKDFIERHFQGEEKANQWSLIEDEAAKLDEGIYSTAIPRDIFLAYSSADQDRVAEMCDFLESEGFQVFVAYRNLRHGAGAQENYLEALYDALRHCKVFLFLSSNHSRTLACDALKVETPYVTDNLPGMKRIEYLLEAYSPKTATSVRILLKKAFPTEWCTNREDLIQRILDATTLSPAICPKCHAVNPHGSAFCARCGQPITAEEKPAAPAPEPQPEPEVQPPPKKNLVADLGLDPEYECLRRPVKKGRKVYYGVYPRSAYSGTPEGTAYGPYTISEGKLYYRNEHGWYLAEPLQWRILSTGIEGTLILCEEVIDEHRFNEVYDGPRDGVYANNYAASEIRHWLNADFLSAAFPAGYHAACSVTVDNSGSSTERDDNSYACGDTDDIVFLPSVSEMSDPENGFDADVDEHDEARRAKSTPFAIDKKVRPYTPRRKDVDYYLRSPNFEGEGISASIINDDGEIGYHSVDADEEYEERPGIRPAMVVDLDYEGGEMALPGGTPRKKKSVDDESSWPSPASNYYFKFSQISGGYMIEGKGSSPSAKLVLPSTYDGKPIIRIGDRAFANIEKVTEVYIPGSIKIIGKEAFCSMPSLKRVVFGAGVEEIGYRAFFYDKELRTVFLPKNLKVIREEAFYECQKITEIDIPGSCETIEKSAFHDTKALHRIIFHSGTKSIGESAFSCAAITELKLPDTIQTIESQAFFGCNGLGYVDFPASLHNLRHGAFTRCKGIREVRIPATLTNIEYAPFCGCNAIQTIDVDPANPRYDSRDRCNAIIETKTNVLVQGCTNTEIPKGIGVIGQGAFEGMTEMTGVHVPDSVTEIGGNAFTLCEKLKVALMPSHLETLGKEAFSHCLALEGLILPGGLHTIGDYAFSYCKSLEKIVIPKSVTSAGSSVFYHSPTNVKIEGKPLFGLPAGYHPEFWNGHKKD